VESVTCLRVKFEGVGWNESPRVRSLLVTAQLKRIKSVLRSSMAQEKMYNLTFQNTEQDIVHKIYFTNIIDLFTTAKKTEKDCFKCFVLRTYNFGFRSHLFLYQKFFWCQFNLKKIPILFQSLRLLYFQKSYMNIKLRFQLGSGPLIFTLRQGPCCLNPALLGAIPPSVESPPIDLSSSLQWTPSLATFQLWI